MADNAFIKIGTALLKHQVKKLVGEETLGVIGEELADIGGDKLDAWLGDKSTFEEIEKAATSARDNFRGKVNDDELEQWMVMLPIHNLPNVLSAIEELPTSSDETKLENALRESVTKSWARLSPEQVDNAVNSFLTCLRSALLPIEKQTLMVIGREVLRTGEKVDLLIRWFEQYVITGKTIEIKQLNPEPVETWNLKHPYAMPPNFTGRVDERKMFVDWLNNDNENRLFILRALGGFGKSALSWHWLTHDVDSKQWTKVLWWSFYEGDASFEHFIEETLKYLKLEVPQGQRPQVDELLKAMQSQKVLIIMDGFERALRAYSSMNAAYQADESPLPVGEGQGEGGTDCVNINAEIFLKSICSLPDIKSKVLMTTRLTPRAVKPRGEFMLGCCEEELTAMQKADAVEFFHKQKIKGTNTEIETACAPYGYHPLSLRLLAGRILKDFETPADIVVAQKLKIDGDIIQQKHHVLEVSYNSLSSHEQKLLSTIACFRSPVELKTLQSIAENKDSLETDLHDLVERGLLHFDDKNKKFDLHPIVRRYAYDRLTAPNRTVAHTRLIDYFEAIPKPKKVEKLEDLAPVIELYHHTVRAGMFDKALDIFANHLSDSLYFNFGAYTTIVQLLRELFRDGKETDSLLLHEDNYAWASSVIATSYSLSGQPRRAMPFFKVHNKLRKKSRRIRDYAVGLENMALVSQISIGALRESEKNLRTSIELRKEMPNQKIWVGVSNRELGRLLSYRGLWDDAKQNLEIAYKLFDKGDLTQSKSAVMAYRALHILLKYRDHIQSRRNSAYAIRFAKNSLEIAKKMESAKNPYPRDLVHANWFLGSAYLFSTQLEFAEEHLTEALTRCRAINLVEMEANILLDLARLRYDQKNYDEAKSLAEEALSITERCGYVLQGADVNLFLAQYALEQENDKIKAKEYAEEAKKLATCDGPPYYYKVAYDEAERMLASLKV